MLPPEGVQAALLRLSLPQMIQTHLIPGQSLQGVIDGAQGNWTLLVAGQRIPLPEASQFVTGQTVTVEVVMDGETVQLRVSPSSTSQPSPAPLAEFVSTILESLGLPQAPDASVALLPAALPHSEPALRTLLSLFAARESSGADLHQIAQLVAQAGAAGAVTQEVAAGVVALISQVVASDVAGFQDAVRRSADGAAKTLESRIVQVLAGTETLDEVLIGDLRTALMRLRSDGTLMSYLRRTGHAGGFEDAVDRVLGRLEAGHLQNLHGLDRGYVFIDLPLDPSMPLRRAQIHILSEGRGQGRGFDAKNSLVVLDLSTTRMGDLWITLRTAAGQCQCHFRATIETAVAAIQEAAPELAQALEKAGYSNPSVNAALWSGDRLREVAMLMQRPHGINLTA